MKDNRICQECGTEFKARAHNQKFCKPECCKASTSRRLLEQYHSARKRINGPARPCSQCGNPLSRYNEDIICESCSNDQKERDYSQEIMGILKNAGKSNNV